jgi:hypothetical protein
MILALAIALVAFFGFIFWLWMLVECVTKESDQGNTKIVWVIIIIFTNLVGAVLYFLIQRPKHYVEEDLPSGSKVGPL